MAFAHSKPQFDVCNFSCVDSGGLNGWACYCTDGLDPYPMVSAGLGWNPRRHIFNRFLVDCRITW